MRTLKFKLSKGIPILNLLPICKNIKNCRNYCALFALHRDLAISLLVGPLLYPFPLLVTERCCLHTQRLLCSVCRNHQNPCYCCSRTLKSLIWAMLAGDCSYSKLL